MYIKHEDTIKLPGSLILNHNQSQFRIFFTDDTITCYTCKTTGHTAQTCKRYIADNIETPLNTFPPSKNIEINQSSIDLATPPIGSDHSTIQTSQNNIPQTNRITNEEPLLSKTFPISNIDINNKTMEANILEQHIKSPHQTTINTEQIFQTEQTGTQYKRAISDTSS
jgi:hypothetical protein